MKQIREGERWWIGLSGACETCGSVQELEETDRVYGDVNSVSVCCPFCVYGKVTVKKPEAGK